MTLRRSIFSVIGILSVLACGWATPTPTLPAVGLTTPNPTPILVTDTVPATVASLPQPTLPIGPTATQPVPDTGWELLRPGLERRSLNLFDEQNRHVEQIYLLRLEPAGYQIGVAYQPAKPLSLTEWQTATGALIVVNGGYYRVEEDRFLPAGLLIIEGERIGQSYGSFAGMLAVTASGPELRWLEQRPYNPEEPLVAGLQSFPLLVKPGGELGFPERNEDGRRARRTVIAQDRQGRLLFLVATKGYFTLHQLSLYLVNSDLDLDIALNLDGGPSSGLLMAEPAETVPAFSTLPIVITVQPR